MRPVADPARDRDLADDIREFVGVNWNNRHVPSYGAFHSAWSPSIGKSPLKKLDLLVGNLVGGILYAHDHGWSADLDYADDGREQVSSILLIKRHEVLDLPCHLTAGLLRVGAAYRGLGTLTCPLKRPGVGQALANYLADRSAAFFGAPPMAVAA